MKPCHTHCERLAQQHVLCRQNCSAAGCLGCLPKQLWLGLFSNNQESTRGWGDNVRLRRAVSSLQVLLQIVD